MRYWLLNPCLHPCDGGGGHTEREFFPQGPHVIKRAHVPQVSGQLLPTSSFMVFSSLKAGWAVNATPYTQRYNILSRVCYTYSLGLTVRCSLIASVYLSRLLSLANSEA